MPIPTRTVEIEFDAGVWTDVSADVVSISTRRGRNRESGAFETGQMTVTLRNDTRKYDPDHTSGTYYGKLRPNRRIRWRNTYSATTLGAFQGYIDRISQQYGGPNDATAEITASDLFKLLARTELPRSVYVATVTADTPDLWWPMDEPSGSTVITDVQAGKVTARTMGTPGLGAAGLVVRDPGSAMGVAGSLTTGTGAVMEAVTWPTQSISGTGAFTIEAWVQAGNQADNATIFYQGGTSDISTYIHFNIRGAGAFVGLLELRIGLTAFVMSTIRVDDNAVHHVAGRRDGSGNLEVFVDGVNVTGAGASTAVSIPNADMAWGATPWQTLGLTGTIQHGAVYRTVALATARIDAHNAAGRTPWNGEASGARLLHIYDLAAIPAGDLATDAGSTTLQATSLGGTALGYAQKVEETEAGRLFVNRDGKVKFLSRYNGDIGPYLTSNITLVDADSGAGQGYRAVSADVDEATIVTRATVSREGSVAVTYNDTAAQAEFKIIDETHDGLLHNSDTYSKYYAEWIVNTHKTPVSRLGALALELGADLGSTYITLLALDLADRVTYKRKPQNTGAVITQDMRIEAIEHETGGGYWRMRLQLSPFNLGAGGYGIGIWDASLWDQAVWGL